jgi:hypothetical protein
MSILRYPSDTPPDFMTITAYDYSARTSSGPGGGVGGDRAGSPAGGVVLPIPDLPNVVSQQKYGAISGALNNLLATGLGEAYVAINDAVTTGQEMSPGAVSDIAERVRAAATDAGGPVLRELAGAAAGSIVGLNSAQFQTMAAGEISNPQMELLYAGPTLRSYSFNWTMVPKSAQEAQSIFEIIKFLKQSHLPEGNGRGPGMLKVPRVFKIGTNIKGSTGKHYQRFFTSVLEGISVKQNSTGQHMTLPGGEPLATTMSCVFKEIFINTREDFQDNI